MGRIWEDGASGRTDRQTDRQGRQRRQGRQVWVVWIMLQRTTTGEAAYATLGWNAEVPLAATQSARQRETNRGLGRCRL